MTTDSLGANALVLSGLAARALGWRPGEFWDATPAELASALAPPPGSAAGEPIGRADMDRMMKQEFAR